MHVRQTARVAAASVACKTDFIWVSTNIDRQRSRNRFEKFHFIAISLKPKLDLLTDSVLIVDGLSHAILTNVVLAIAELHNFVGERQPRTRPVALYERLVLVERLVGRIFPHHCAMDPERLP